jgi:site-specific recombinase XerC
VTNDAPEHDLAALAVPRWGRLVETGDRYDGGKPERVGRYRPSLPRRIPRSIPAEWFNKLFAALPSHRDRALVAFWISTRARASELLGIRQCDVDPGQQLVSVVRKGSRAVQQVLASADAFVWLRLYQQGPDHGSTHLN